MTRSPCESWDDKHATERTGPVVDGKRLCSDNQDQMALSGHSKNRVIKGKVAAILSARSLVTDIERMPIDESNLPWEFTQGESYVKVGDRVVSVADETGTNLSRQTLEPTKQLLGNRPRPVEAVKKSGQAPRSPLFSQGLARC